MTLPLVGIALIRRRPTESSVRWRTPVGLPVVQVSLVCLSQALRHMLTPTRLAAVPQAWQAQCADGAADLYRLVRSLSR